MSFAWNLRKIVNCHILFMPRALIYSQKRICKLRSIICKSKHFHSLSVQNIFHTECNYTDLMLKIGHCISKSINRKHLHARCCTQTQLIFSWKANQICILGQYNWCEFPTNPSALSTGDIPKKYIYKPQCIYAHKPNIYGYVCTCDLRYSVWKQYRFAIICVCVRSLSLSLIDVVKLIQCANRTATICLHCKQKHFNEIL